MSDVGRGGGAAKIFSSLAKAPTKSAHSLTASKEAKARSTVAAYLRNRGSEASVFSLCRFHLRSAFLAAGLFHILSSSAG